MFIHFAFGTLAKQGKIDEQTEEVIEFILKEKRLKASGCTEFIPVLPQPNTKRIPMEMFKKTNTGIEAEIELSKLHELPDNNTIAYLPMNVSMVCFIKIAFNKLKESSHQNEYGKFGLVLTDSFLKKKGIKPVLYYNEESLWRDSLILKWNRYVDKGLTKEERAELEREILAYRKPAKLFPSFAKSVTAVIQSTGQQSDVKFIKYDRYEENYDFTRENEYRIIFDKVTDYLYFDERDLFMIFTPDLKAKAKIEAYLNKTWERRPTIKVYPI